MEWAIVGTELQTVMAFLLTNPAGKTVSADEGTYKQPPFFQHRKISPIEKSKDRSANCVHL
jgi:hypothetical protein